MEQKVTVICLYNLFHDHFHTLIWKNDKMEFFILKSGFQ